MGLRAWRPCQNHRLENPSCCLPCSPNPEAPFPVAPKRERATLGSLLEQELSPEEHTLSPACNHKIVDRISTSEGHVVLAIHLPLVAFLRPG